VYFRHPSRDFAQTGEALRVRITGDQARITYKGPILDTRAKIRHEIELPVGASAADAQELEQMLRLLGFEPLRAVEKSRTPYRLDWEGRPIELTVDEVSGVGTYLEIEGMADEKDREAVRDAILRLADRLGLANPERKSYLRLLLEKDGV
ncbi:MAG: class IV adenylate cyclase, partial [Planctomycetaceae bacterium]